MFTAHPSFIQSVLVNLKINLMDPGAVIIDLWDEPKNIYFIHYGEVNVYDQKELYIVTLEEGKRALITCRFLLRRESCLPQDQVQLPVQGHAEASAVPHDAQKQGLFGVTSAAPGCRPLLPEDRHEAEEPHAEAARRTSRVKGLTEEKHN